MRSSGRATAAQMQVSMTPMYQHYRMVRKREARDGERARKREAAVERWAWSPNAEGRNVPFREGRETGFPGGVQQCRKP